MGMVDVGVGGEGVGKGNTAKVTVFGVKISRGCRLQNLDPTRLDQPL